MERNGAIMVGDVENGPKRRQTRCLGHLLFIFPVVQVVYNYIFWYYPYEPAELV